MPWVDPETGEATDECPICEATRRDCEAQIISLERDLRTWRMRTSKAEAKAVEIEESKRDGAEWKRVVAYWQSKFPNKKITSKSMKSSRATAYFQRIDAGAGEDDFFLAIDGAVKLPFVVYGSRRASGSGSDLRVDLQHIASIGNDAQFDALVEAGRRAREEAKEELF